MGCKTRVVGRVINEKCDCCPHSLHWHNILHSSPMCLAPMPEDGWPCLACDWEKRLAAIEKRHKVEDDEARRVRYRRQR